MNSFVQRTALVAAIVGFGLTSSTATPVAKAPQASLRQDLEQRALQYFLKEAHPVSGLVRDNASNFGETPASNRMASLAATGFGLATIVNAGKRGLVPREVASSYALRTLRFVRDHVTRRHGWLTHFVDWETGERLPGSEISTVDTALFLGGALYAAEVFNGTEIDRIANEIYRDVDYIDMLTDGGAKPNKLTLSMAYFPESGTYNSYQWSMPAEQMLLLLLGLGHPTRPLPAASWTAWQRTTHDVDARPLIGAEMPLFVHQYSQLFIDFRNFRDSFGNYYDNAVRATDFNRSTCAGRAKDRTFREGFWGLSAGAIPTGYAAVGPYDDSSTACIDCVLGSVMYRPEQVMADVSKWLSGPYRARIFGQYGLVDSIDLDQNWFSGSVYGITVGPVFMSFANLDESTSIWSDFNQIPAVKKALATAASAQ